MVFKMAKTKDLIKKYEREVLYGRDLQGNFLSNTQLAYRKGFLEVKCKSTTWEQLYNKYLNARGDVQKAYYNGALTRYKAYIKFMNGKFNSMNSKHNGTIEVCGPRGCSIVRYNDDLYFNEI